MNEVALYMSLVILATLCDTVSSIYHQKILGWILIGLVLATMVYNGVVIALFTFSHLRRLFLRRQYRQRNPLKFQRHQAYLMKNEMQNS